MLENQDENRRVVVAPHSAWIEDNRRKDNKALWEKLAGAALAAAAGGFRPRRNRGGIARKRQDYGPTLVFCLR